jgi:EAL domain-containing protein (putative c-di-GMP-specific phosphodiesterase class I)/response regulator of citrate/malate metabolism
MNHILIIDDDHDFRQLVCTYLKKIYPQTIITEYDPIASGIPPKDFDWSEYDFLILDYYLCIQNFTGLDLLKREQTNPLFPASIMLTGAGNEEVAAKSLKFGANKYIDKQGLTKTQLKESIEEAWQRHQDNLRKRRLIERRNHAFNKRRFYQQLESTPGLDFNRLTRCILSMEIVSEGGGGKIDLLSRNSILKHLSLICFRFLSVRHPELCITTLTDDSLALILDYGTDQNAIRTEISQLQTEVINNSWRSGDDRISYGISTTVAIVNEQGLTGDDITGQFRAAIIRARTVASGNNHVLLHHVSVEKPAATGELEESGATAKADTAADAQAGEQQPSETQIPPVTPAAPQPADAPAKPSEPVAPAAVEAADIESGETLETATSEGPTEANGDAFSTTTTTSPAATPSHSYEIRLDESTLGEQDRKIIQALDEQRIIQLFQPIIVFSSDLFDYNEVFHVSLRMVDKAGDEESAKEIFSTQENPEVSKYMDRWMIKEIIGHIVDTGAEDTSPMFIIKLSHHSLSDTTLFNWLRALLSGIESFRPGEFITLEISMAAMMHNRKQISALIQYLAKTYGFHFALGHIEDINDIKSIVDQPAIHMLILESATIEQLKSIKVEGEQADNFVNLLRKQHIHLIARDIHDSGQLMAAIAAGADLAMGDFVGTPQTQLDEFANIETYDLDKRLNSTVY